MTIDKAIPFLRDLKATTELNLHNAGMHDYHESLDMAIRSLEAWEKVTKKILIHEDVWSTDEILEVIDECLKEVKL